MNESEKNDLVDQRRQARAEKHQLDSKLMDLHRRVVGALLDPINGEHLRLRALQQIRKWEHGSLCDPIYINAWRSILNLSPAAMGAAILRPGSEGIALRQNSPFGAFGGEPEELSNDGHSVFFANNRPLDELPPLEIRALAMIGAGLLRKSRGNQRAIKELHDVALPIDGHLYNPTLKTLSRLCREAGGGRLEADDAILREIAKVFAQRIEDPNFLRQDVLNGRETPECNATKSNTTQLKRSASGVDANLELIRELMPCLRTLRDQGFSFDQLTSMFNGATGEVGPKLLPVTFTEYYERCLADLLEDGVNRYAALFDQAVERLGLNVPLFGEFGK